jgi:large subunit ribosomal protein L23Ae
VTKAVKAGKAAKTGVQKKVHTPRTSVHFRRPKTLKLARHPKYPRKSAPRRNKFDHFAIIKHPLTTESVMKKIEEQNTLVFICDVRANKNHIKAAVKKLYNVQASKINTLIRYVCWCVLGVPFFLTVSCFCTDRMDRRRPTFV